MCALVAGCCAAWSVTAVSLAPPGIEARQVAVAAAATRLSIDRPSPLISDALATDYDLETLQKRADLLASLGSTSPALARIAEHAGLNPGEIAAVTPVTSAVQTVFIEPDSERRADQIAGAARPYRLELRSGQSLPTIDVYAQAPTVSAATRLADAVVPGLRDYLDALTRRDGATPANQVRLTELGHARGAVVNAHAGVEIALFTFLYVFILTGALALLVARVRAGRAPAVEVREPGANEARTAGSAGDWPRTLRPLPWLLAVMMAIVFLVPFNDIMLNISLPIDLYLDRFVLPVIVGVWALALSAGGRDAPRVRLTWVHGAIGLVVGIAGLSLVLGARDINQTLEFDLAVKKLALLGSYTCLFLVVASSVRRSEVRAFMTLTLGLAMLCAVGMIVEYRFAYNVFYKLSDATFPSIFSIGNVDSVGVDEIGRREIRGPAQASLEAVAMMSMALPIAVARTLDATRRRERLLYGVATAVVLAGIVATYRKTAFLAPISVFLTIAYFRRGELAKLVPVGVALVIVIQALSPGALSGVLGQLDRNRLGVTTVSDRAADYDAIRPDLWSHLLMGRGYGSYEPSSYRILDMELLRQLIEVGVIGLLAYILLPIVVVAVARRPIRSRDPDRAPVALAAAAAAVCFGVVSVLFDVMSFPHVPYIFLWMAALLAVVAPERRPARPPAQLAEPRPQAVREVELEPAWSS